MCWAWTISRRAGDHVYGSILIDITTGRQVLPGGSGMRRCSCGRSTCWAGVFLADRRECKVLTGIDDCSRFIVVAAVLVQPSGQGCQAFIKDTGRRGGRQWPLR